MLALRPPAAGIHETPPSFVRKTVGGSGALSVPASTRSGAPGATAMLIAQLRVGGAPAVCAETLHGARSAASARQQSRRLCGNRPRVRPPRRVGACALFNSGALSNLATIPREKTRPLTLRSVGSVRTNSRQMSSGVALRLSGVAGGFQPSGRSRNLILQRRAESPPLRQPNVLRNVRRSIAAEARVPSVALSAQCHGSVARA